MEKTKKTKEMEKINISSLISRIKSETPIFWVKIRKIGLICGAVGGAVKASIETNSMQLEWAKPEYYNSMILAGVIVASLSSLTVVPQSDEK